MAAGNEAHRADSLDNFRKGHLHWTDSLAAGDPALGAALYEYAQAQDTNRQSNHWTRVLPWVENMLFGNGRQYINDILVNRLSQGANGNFSITAEVAKNIPQPTNDILSQYLEPNIALLTENKPRPRITAKSDKIEDIDAAELSELTMEYLWEALNMPEKHREIARMILYTGISFMEICWDPTLTRRMSVPQTEDQAVRIAAPGLPSVTLPGITRPGVKLDKKGRPVMTDQMEFGEIAARIVSPFEFHIPTVHEWDGEDMGWVMREFYTPLSSLLDKYGDPKMQRDLGGKRKGWYWDNLADVGEMDIQTLPLWWWERMGDMVEGSGQGLFAGSPEMWKGYTVVRIFDRKPNVTWPRGRTVIVAGDKVLYDSPKEIGARAYDPRWPSRWHPYVRFRWEGQNASPYGRALVTKLLPCLKRINSIDTTFIMWRRTVPIATWLAPKGSGIIEDIWTGRPGHIWEYDPIRTRGLKPEPVFPMPYPNQLLEERSMMLQSMEAIAGTQDILRGERPTGVNSASMIDILRKQALASRSPILQSWDESLQIEGGYLLQEVAKHVKEDPRYAERIRILAREKKSSLTIQTFSGSDLSDNVMVRVDTASMAHVSKEAREAKAIEFLQYAPSLVALPLGIQHGILEELGLKSSLQPSGPDVDRAKRMISWIKQGQYDRVIPFPEDDAYIFYELLSREIKSDGMWDLQPEQQDMLIKLLDIYKQQIMVREQQQQMQAIMMANAQKGNTPDGGGESSGQA